LIKLDRLGVDAEWVRMPLCCSYLLVSFANLVVYAREEDFVQPWRFCWAIGALRDGERELLGAWYEPVSDEADWSSVFEDLQLRGVKKIRFLAGIDSVRVERAVRRSFPSAKRLPSTRQFLQQIESKLSQQSCEAASDFVSRLYVSGTAQRARAALADFEAGPWGVKCPVLIDHGRLALEQLDPFYALAPRLRGVVRTTDMAAQQVNRNLSRAGRRRGCFPSPEAAASFVAKSLIRAERGFGDFEASATSSVGHHAVIANAVIDIAVPGR
jgi:putative transposase